MAAKFKVKKGDTVIVLTGREKGKSGEIIRMLPKEKRVLVRDVNMVKRHTKPSPTNPGGIVDKEAPIHVSNVMLLDPKTGEPTRVRRQKDKDGTVERLSVKSGQPIPRSG